jgi:hypothetical protein
MLQMSASKTTSISTLTVQRRLSVKQLRRIAVSKSRLVEQIQRRPENDLTVTSPRDKIKVS